MDKLESMKLFLKVSELNSFSAASRVLSIPLPTLSRKISELENSLGVRLLHRTTRKLTLTEPGYDYVTACKRIIEQVDDAEKELQGEYSEPKGELVITAPVMFGREYILPIVSEFLEQYEHISIKLLLADGNRDLYNDEIDAAVRLGELPDSNLVATSVGRMRTVTCVSDRLIEKFGQISEPKDLAKFPCISLNVSMPNTQWSYYDRELLQNILVEVKSKLTISDTQAAAYAAEQSVGVTQQLFYQVHERIKNNKLNIVLESFEKDPIPINFIHKSRHYMPKKLRLFLDFAAERLKLRLNDL